MFGFIRDKIKKVYSGFTQKISSLFDRNILDEQFIKELTTLLISADTGVKTTQKIIDWLKDEIKQQRITTMDEVRKQLEILLVKLLDAPGQGLKDDPITLMVGVNGSGKTTFSGKLASRLKAQGNKVLLVAGDTFRAAATEQLVEWGKRIGVEVFIGKPNQDPASVIFDGCIRFLDGNFDRIIIDTAGRLQTKSNLMRELEKIRRIIDKQLSDYPVATWLTIDAMLGQNSLRQAEVFNEATQLTGVVLTKFDGTGKGGIVFSVAEQLKLPVVYITFGEGLDDIKPFRSDEYVRDLLNN